MFNEAFMDGDLAVNPAARIARMPEKRTAEIDPFTDDELAAILKTAEKNRRWRWYREYIRHGYESGFRLEESNGLKWPRVDLAARLARIREVRTLRQTKDPKTVNAARDAEI